MKNRYDDALVCPVCSAVQLHHVPEEEDRTNVVVRCENCGRFIVYDVTVIHSYYIKVVE